MKPNSMSRSSITINNIWKARGRRPTLRRTCKVFIPRDLRHLDTLRVPACYEKDHPLVTKLKLFTRHKLHHCILVASLFFYLYIGSIMFQYLEHNFGKVSYFNISETREGFLSSITNVSYEITLKREHHLNELHKYEKELVKQVLLGYQGGDTIGQQRPYWSTSTAIMYCLTIITTVGYGNVAPSSTPGQIATIIYAILGIPLMLLVLADLGKLFTKALKFAYHHFRRICKVRPFRKKQLAESENHSNKPLQYMTVSWRTVSQDYSSVDDSENPKNDKYVCNEVTTLTLHNDNLYKDLDQLEEKEANQKHIEVDDEFCIPVTLVMTMLLLYMVIGALLFSCWEGWTVFESFYFVFISMSTVGIGDYVPSNEQYMMGAFAYLVFGLTLASTCINVTREKLTMMFQKAKVQIGTVDLDVNVLMSKTQKSSKNISLNPFSLQPTEYRSTADISEKLNCHSNTPRPIRYMRKNASTCDLPENKKDYHNALSQNQFTLYDSPYSTVCNDLVYNTVTSISSISVSRLKI